MPGSKVTADMKKEAFARIIFADPKTPKWLAAQEAGYKGTQNTLYSQASKLVNDPKVLAWLSRLAEEADAEAVVDYDRVVKDLAGLKIPTLPDYWKDGQLRDPETLSPDSPMAYALNVMSLGGFRHIPLVDAKGRPVGVVSVRDIVNHLVDHFSDKVLNLPPRPGGDIPRSREGA